MVGVDVREIYFMLVNEGESATFSKMMRVLDDYFVSKSNVPFKRHLFRQIAQAGDEMVDQFVCRLQQWAVSCDFGVLEDEHVHDQVIDKCHSSHLRHKFLEQEGSVTLDSLLQIARAQEAGNHQLKEMEQRSNQSHLNTVNGRSSGGVWSVGEARNTGGTKGGKKPEICYG